MKTKLLIWLIFLLIASHGFSQDLPLERRCDWKNPGAHELDTKKISFVNPLDFGADSSGRTDCTTALNSAIMSLQSRAGVILFPPGKYMFLSTIQLRDSLVIRGSCAENTYFIFDLKGRPEDCFLIRGKKNVTSVKLAADALKSSKSVAPAENLNLKKGDWIKIFEEDANRITSSWASNSIGQLVKVKDIQNNVLILEEELRMDFTLLNQAAYTIVYPAKNIGLESFTIERKDATSSQTQNFNLELATNCWVTGIASRNCNFSHITIQESSHINVKNSHFSKAFDYGGGGKGYGITLQQTSGRCFISNNIFENLRHSILLQSAANGNVIAYNYSKDPFWTGTILPSNSAGDIVLHGNYPFQNLFEGNICQNIVIDNSHGINGPYNTFYRNRAELYGIFMNEGAGDLQNFIGNEITHTLLGQYFKTGKAHYEFGNNRNQVNIPPNTSQLTTNTLFLEGNPDCLSDFTNFPSIGYPNKLNEGKNGAKERYENGFTTICSDDNNIFRESINILSPKNICTNAESLFSTPYTPCSELDWTTSNGKIISGQGTRYVKIEWNQPGEAIITLKHTFNKVTETISSTVQVKDCTETETLNHRNIYVNLHDGNVNIVSSVDEPVQNISIFNTQGQNLFSLNIGATNTWYQTKNLVKGIYLITFFINNIPHHKKILIY